MHASRLHAGLRRSLFAGVIDCSVPCLHAEKKTRPPPLPATSHCLRARAARSTIVGVIPLRTTQCLSRRHVWPDCMRAHCPCRSASYDSDRACALAQVQVWMHGQVLTVMPLFV